MKTADLPLVAFSSLLIFVGLIVSWEDFRRSKIRNKWIKIGLIGGVGLHVFFVVYFSLFFTNATVNFYYLKAVFLNALISLVFGYSLWKMEIWSAGDSKFFFVLAFLLPHDFYSGSYIRYFPSFNLAINIIAVSIVVVVIRVIFGLPKTIFSQVLHFRIDDFKTSVVKTAKAFAANWFVFFIMFAAFNGLYLLMGYMQSFIRSGEAAVFINIAYLLILFAAMGPVTRKIEEAFKQNPRFKIAAFLVIIGFLYWILGEPGMGRKVADGAQMIAGFMVFVGFSKKLLELHLKKTDVRTVKVSEVMAGIVLTEESREKIAREIPLESFFMDGLTEEQVEAIRSHLPGEEDLEVVTTIPFAPLAFAGTILTMIMRQSVIHAIITRIG